jgi:NaMN:DMB phosphoribosyltransferase
MGELGRTAERLGSLYRGRGVGTPLRKLLFVAAAGHGSPSGQTAIRRLVEGRAPAASLAMRSKPESIMKSDVKAMVVDFGPRRARPSAAEGGLDRAVPGHREESWAELVSAEVAAAEGTGDVTERAAMSRQTALAAVRSGIEVMTNACSGGDVDLVGTAALGLGGEVGACAIAAVLTDKPVAELTGAGSKGGKALAAAVQKALDRPSPDPLDAIGVLSEYGGLDVGGLAGACLAAAALGLPVVLGGLVPTAAAAVALDLAPAARRFLFASDRAALPAHGALLEYLGLAPLLALGLDAAGGGGVGAVLGMDMIEAAWELVRAGR